MQASLSDFIAAPDFPCVMAKSVMSKGYFEHKILSDADVQTAARKVLKSIYRFIEEFRLNPKRVSSFAVTFEHPSLLQFDRFEKFFWSLLKELSELDQEKYLHDSRVSSDPGDSDFSFSLKEEAFFILVLHPESPRLARRYAHPTVVFNAHQQFEDLRKKGLFQKVRDLIRKRDIALQGNINPMLKDHGEESEVFQYTGKAYPPKSKCPFH